MNNENNQDKMSGQGGIDQETERRNRENETGQQKQAQTPESQSDQAEAGQSGGQSQSDGQSQSGDQGGSGFVGSGGDQSSDYLTKGEKQDFQPEGQGASDSNAGDADITTGQPMDKNSTPDDGSDSR